MAFIASLNPIRYVNLIEEFRSAGSSVALTLCSAWWSLALKVSLTDTSLESVKPIRWNRLVL